MKKDKELWKDIEGYKGLYQVSNLGRIKRLEHENKFGNRKRMLKEKIMKLNENKHGYRGVNFSINGKVKAQSVHRLVATYFIPNVENLPEVNHKNGDKSNNKYFNLEWCSRKENMRHAHDNNLINHKGTNSILSKLEAEEVIEIRTVYNAEAITYQQLAEKFGVGTSTIGRVIREEVYSNV